MNLWAFVIYMLIGAGLILFRKILKKKKGDDED